MKSEPIPISKLTLLKDNPRRITKDQMQKLCKSITDDPTFLECRPVLVNRVGSVLNVYAGNQRVRAAKTLKIKEIPCIVEDDIDEEIISRRVILDNKTFGEFDFDMLANTYNLDVLLDLGFTPLELQIDSIDSIDSVESDGQKKTKQKTCPHCGEEL